MTKINEHEIARELRDQINTIPEVDGASFKCIQYEEKFKQFYLVLNVDRIWTDPQEFDWIYEDQGISAEESPKFKAIDQWIRRTNVIEESFKSRGINVEGLLGDAWSAGKPIRRIIQ